MKHMFYNCENLKAINLFAIDTKNVKDMSEKCFMAVNP